MRTCRKCNTDQLLDEFYLNGKYRRHTCRTCDNKSRKGRSQNYSEAALANRVAARKKREQRQSQERKECINTPYYILKDSRASDRKHKRENDLTNEFIKKQIVKGCSYCDATEIRMTLDRVDNNHGHTMDNVVPACVMCNHVRGDMPYEAWIVVARAMKRARKRGLFGDWKGRSIPWSKQK